MLKITVSSSFPHETNTIYFLLISCFIYLVGVLLNTTFLIPWQQAIGHAFIPVLSRHGLSVVKAMHIKGTLNVLIICPRDRYIHVGTYI